VYTHKNHVLLHLPETTDAALWLEPAEALALAAQLRVQAKQQMKIDQWLVKYDPKSYEGKQARARIRKLSRGVK
jgi:ABC-type multidrug transport system ATPase subunit